jgi:ribosomal protein S18 acetylase RimI-like enzyme
MVEPLTDSHVDAVSNLHAQSLTGLLRDLGGKALRAFYTGAIKSDYAIAFVIREQDVLQGFVFGSTNPPLLKQEILKNAFLATFLGVCLGVLRKPSTLISLWKSTRASGESSYDTEVPELTYLAVDEKCRTGGRGQQLLDRFGQALVERGVFAYELSVDADNEAAIDFYQRQGFMRVGEYEEFGLNHYRYHMDLS